MSRAALTRAARDRATARFHTRRIGVVCAPRRGLDHCQIQTRTRRHLGRDTVEQSGAHGVWNGAEEYLYLIILLKWECEAPPDGHWDPLMAFREKTIDRDASDGYGVSSYSDLGLRLGLDGF